MLLKSEEAGAYVVVMEVSSHSLAEKRVKNLEFSEAVFTNLTQDHLDYHLTMDNYRNVKASLFRQLATNGTAIINADDNSCYHMMISNNKNLTYGFSNSTYQILSYNYQNDKMNICYKYNNKTYDVLTNLLGRHNVYNLIAVISSMHCLGINIESVNKVIPFLTPPSGRLEVINYKNNKIIIDYAHTCDAVKNVLNTAKEFSTGKIYCIIGCGGNRDTSKRPMMASVALSLCDMVILTSDNPRNEDPKKIINDMIYGNEKYNNYDIIIDRCDAIKKAISMLGTNDTLMILGKGHENYQIIGDTKYHFDDREEVYKYIKR